MKGLFQLTTRWDAMKGRSVSIALGVLFVVAPTAWTASLPSAPPEQVGLSSERVGQLLKHEITQGRLPGAVALVARKGRIAYSKSFGVRDPTNGAPMASDASFGSTR